MGAYATGQNLTERYDIDLIGDLSTDDREELSRSVIPSHANVQAALTDASGEIDVAMQSGGRYTPDQLSDLTGNSRNHLVRITCAIAMSLLIERRPDRVNMELAEGYRKPAKAHLDALRRGENVFGIQEHIDAGSIDMQTVSATEIDQMNLLPNRMPRYFPGTDQRASRAR